MSSRPLTADSARVVQVVESTLGQGCWTPRLISRNPDGQRVYVVSRPGRAVIAKLRPDTASTRDVEALSQLSARHFATLRVPAAIMQDSDPGILLMERIAGRPLDGLDPSPSAESFERVGRALRELHESGVDLGRPLGLADHIAQLIRPSLDALAEWDVDTRHLVGRFLEAAARLDRIVTPIAPIHRDFQLRQLFEDGGAVGVVDWDDCGTGDPAFDVAYFATYLRNHLGVQAAQAGIEAFFRGYAPSDETRSRLPVYEAFNYLRRACRRIRLREPGWDQSVANMMGCAAQALDRVRDD